MIFLRKSDVLLIVLVLMIGVGALLYPLAQGPFECLYVNASNVTEIGEGYRLEYDLPESSLELSSAVITLCSCNETVRFIICIMGRGNVCPLRNCTR